MMEIYKVGGAVRDELMGVEAKDVDWVVEGATPQMLVDLGYRPVGQDFPVFHHPVTQEEHALARTERKSGRGYGGFTFDAAPTVTLEEDLGRRDLTINSMARRKDGSVVDPYNGQADLANKVLRHTTEAFQEDPVRLLRVARFLARFGREWTVAPETLTLLQNMVANGEVDFLVPERVWKEFEKGLSESHPLLMLQFLDQLKVFERPPFAEYRFDANSALLKHLEDRAAKGWKGIPQRFALAFARTWSTVETKVSRIPSEVREVTHLFQFCLNMQQEAPYETRTPEQRLAFIEATDAVRQRERFNNVWEVFSQVHELPARELLDDVRKLEKFSSKDVIGDCKDGKEIGRRVRAAKLAML